MNTSGFPRSVVSSVLGALCGRRVILHVDNCNWAQVDWPVVFNMSRWMHVFYKFKRVYLNEIERLGEDDLKDKSFSGFPRCNYREAAYDGFAMWELAKTGILASLETTQLSSDLTDREWRVVSFYYEKCRCLIAGTRAALRHYAPDTLLVTQGCTPMTRPLVEVARQEGINVVATEGSFLRDYFFCDNATGMIVNRHRGGKLDGDWIASRAPSRDERRRFRQHLAEAQKHKRKEHVTGEAGTGTESIRGLLNIPPGKKIAVFIGQVMTDASILMDSPVFPDPVVLITRVIEYFRDKNDWFLVVRLHPKETTGFSWANSAEAFGPPPGEGEGPIPYSDLTLRQLRRAKPDCECDRCKVVSGTGADTNSLLDEAMLGITINSQAGFEMALKHKRVVVCGDAFFARKGFTFDVSRPEALEPTLDAACEEVELSDAERFGVDRYGRHLLDHVLFRRDFKGQWERLFRALDGGPAHGYRMRRMKLAFAHLDKLASEMPENYAHKKFVI